MPPECELAEYKVGIDYIGDKCAVSLRNGVPLDFRRYYGTVGGDLSCVAWSDLCV